MLNELIEALERAPHQYGFFEAVRRLQRADTAMPRIGSSARPVDDPVRFGQPPSLAFAPSTVAGFESRGDGQAPRLEVNFLGLFGPNGPLPTHLTEYAHERQHNAGDSAFARFADVFHHRMLSLFFRAWATTQPAVDRERPESSAYADQIGSLIGIGREPLRQRDAVPDVAKLHFAGHLGNATRHAEGLRAMVAELFELPVEIDEFVGEWIDLPQDGLCRLGRSPETNALGVNVLAGARAWSAQHKFRLRLGPMDLDDYRAFLPGQPALGRLQALVRNYLGDELAWEILPLLRSDAVPAMRLGDALGLGWACWLGPRAQPVDADDLRLDTSLIHPSAENGRTP